MPAPCVALKHGVRGRTHLLRCGCCSTRPSAPGPAGTCACSSRGRAAAQGDVRRVLSSHRTHHPRTLRHDRGRHVLSNPYDGERRGGTVGFRCRAPNCASSTRRCRSLQGPSAASRCAAKTSSSATGACRKKTREIHRRRLLQDRRHGQPRCWLCLDRRPFEGSGHLGGLKRYPKEIEELIDALPGVAESAVIGLPARILARR